MREKDLVELIERTDQLTEAALLEIIADSYHLSQTILMADPDLATDYEFDVFNKKWLKKNWRKILHNADKLSKTDALLGWVIAATTLEITKLLQHGYTFSETTIPSVVALAILIKRMVEDEKAK